MPSSRQSIAIDVALMTSFSGTVLRRNHCRPKIQNLVRIMPPKSQNFPPPYFVHHHHHYPNSYTITIDVSGSIDNGSWLTNNCHRQHYRRRRQLRTPPPPSSSTSLTMGISNLIQRQQYFFVVSSMFQMM